MKKLAVSLVLFGALAACSDGPTQAPDSNEPRVIAVYDETEFASRGITAPNVDAITRAAGTSRVNGVATLDGKKAFGPSAAYYCDEQPIRDVYYEYDPCYPQDCYSNPYGYNCGDPCQWDASLPECAPPPPVGPPAQFSYGSDASGPVWVNQGGTLLKEVSLTSWSTAGANVAFTTLDASFRNVGAQSGAGCGNASQEFDSSHSSGSGNPLTLQSSRVANYLGTIKWEVWGTHGFTPVSGASGGGTFYSSDFVCG